MKALHEKGVKGGNLPSFNVLRYFIAAKRVYPKNRFGSTDEVGVFEMREDGLAEVADPARAFLAEHEVDVLRQRRRPDDGGDAPAARRSAGARRPRGIREPHVDD